MRLEPANWIHYEKRISVLDEIGLRPLAMKTRLLAAQQIDHSSANVDFTWFQSLIKTVCLQFFVFIVSSYFIKKMKKTCIVFFEASLGELSLLKLHILEF